MSAGGVFTTPITIAAHPPTRRPVTSATIPTAIIVAEKVSAPYPRSALVRKDAKQSTSTAMRRSETSARRRSRRKTINVPTATTITLKRSAHHSGDPSTLPSSRNGADAIGITSEK